MQIDSRKKILLAAAVFPPEPVVGASLIMDLANELSTTFDVTVLRPVPTRPLGFKHPPFQCPGNIKVVTLEDTFTCPASSMYGRLRESISLGKAVARYIDDHKSEIDIIYNAVWPLYGKNIVAKAAIRHNIKYITTVQDIYPESILSKLPKWKACRWLVGMLFKNVDLNTQRNAAAIHTISDGMADYLSESRGIDRGRYHVVRNWQNEEDFIKYRESHPHIKPNDEPFTFMYMGNVGPLAGLDTVIDAFMMADIDARLVIAGSGSAKAALMERAKGNPKIIFRDVPAGQVPATQAEAEVMVLPIKKGFASSSIPSKLPAYMFSSKPVLCSVDKDSDTARCIRDARGGWVVPPENPQALAQAMADCILASKATLEEMGENNFHYAINDFSRKRGVKRLASIFYELLS